MQYLICQYDGGGIRGVIFTTCIRLIQQELGINLATAANMHVGTSTGGISGACYASKTSPTEVDNFYVKDGAKVFKKINRFWPPTNLLKPAYDYKPILDEVSDILVKSGLVMPVTLCMLPKMFMCTSVSLLDESTHYFKSFDSTDKDRNVLDCVRATFAAAYYFGKFVDAAHREVWADGGEGQDNCCLRQCWIESLLQGWLDSGNNTKILSFGAGYVKNTRTFEQASALNMPQEALLYPAMARNQSVEDQLFEARTIRMKLPLEILRLDIKMDKDYPLDDVSKIPQFVAMGTQMYKDNRESIKSFLGL